LHYLFPIRRVRDEYDPTQPMSTSGLKKLWQEVREASGLTWFRPYDTRHTGITRQAEHGVPIEIIKAKAGHVSNRMSQHYTHVSLAAQRKWAVPATYLSAGFRREVDRKPVASSRFAGIREVVSA
jgi:integrase